MPSGISAHLERSPTLDPGFYLLEQFDLLHWREWDILTTPTRLLNLLPTESWRQYIACSLGHRKDFEGLVGLERCDSSLQLDQHNALRDGSFMTNDVTTRGKTWTGATLTLTLTVTLLLTLLLPLPLPLPSPRPLLPAVSRAA